MDAQFYSLGMILEQWTGRVLPWNGLVKIMQAIAEENNQ